MRFFCRTADPESLRRIWQKNIDCNPGDDRWVRWRDEYLRMNAEGCALTFIIFCDGEPVGEGTLLFSPECGAVDGRTILADGRTVVNLNALRIEKAFEGQGHVSRMVRQMEDEARRRGFSRITIGVDECETRNRAIYAHWGFDALILDEIEDGERVLYYSKQLAN